MPTDLYGGIANARLEPEQFELPGGVVLRRTYVHLMAHFILAFKRAHPGAPHPAPWKSANSGTAFDVEVELHVPADFALPQWFDHLNTIWWTTALLRLQTSPVIRVPVFSADAFSDLAETNAEARVRVLEVYHRTLVDLPETTPSITGSDLDWIARHWRAGGNLFREHRNFADAFVAFDQSVWAASHGLGLILLWGALELLFATSRYRKTPQLSSRIAAYLEPPGETRAELGQQVRELYGSRSEAAHGSPAGQGEAFDDSYQLLKRVLRRTLEDDYVLTPDDLQRLSEPDADLRVH